VEEVALQRRSGCWKFNQASPSEQIELFNQDPSREYRAIIGHVVYFKVSNGAEFMTSQAN